MMDVLFSVTSKEISKQNIIKQMKILKPDNEKSQTEIRQVAYFEFLIADPVYKSA